MPTSPDLLLKPRGCRSRALSSSRAEQIASLESVLKATSGANPSGARAEFWKLRGLRGAKKMLRKSREDLSVLTKQGRYPPYERVVLKEGGHQDSLTHFGDVGPGAALLQMVMGPPLLGGAGQIAGL